MPIYEYQCEKCGQVIEKWQKITEPPATECESCGGSLKKLVSMSSFHLKGSGWYVTDYARGSGHSRDHKSSSTATKSENSAPKGASDSSTGSEK